MKCWSKEPVQIVNEIDNELGVEWDTDANIATLTQFIQENCDEAQFEAFVRKIAVEDIAMVAAADRAFNQI
jgi:hypothetical protein